MGDGKDKTQGKKLCELVKDDILKTDLKRYKKLVDEPNFICKKCGRTANEKSHLCKDKKLK